ncbi:MAG: DUF560 domain-containing protein [Rhodocyclaceae bacterium]|nr:MAG: DUF560 domain-containing protein [Rhodocyclaceae bacterium]
MQKKALSYRTLLIAAFTGCVALRAAAQTPTQDIKALVEQGKPAEAYALGSQNPDFFGTPDFDFFFGIAAIDAGHADEGVLALERYLLLFPANARARLELARGYFVLGEDGRAKEEFENVKALNPPAEVVGTIDRYLEALQQRAARYETTIRGYVEGGVGTDSNVNGGVSGASISLPIFGPVTVGTAGVQKGDIVQMLAAGAQVTHPVAQGVMVFGAADWDQKAYITQSTLNQDNFNLMGGVNWMQGQHQFRLTAGLSDLELNHGPFRAGNTLGGEWSYQLDDLQSFQVGLQQAGLTYAGANSVRNADMNSAAGAYRRVIPMAWQPVVTLSGSYVTEDNRKQRQDLSRDIYGLRAAVTATPSAAWTLSLAYSYQESPYRQPDPLLLVRRQDSFQSVEFSASYQLNRNLSLRGELSWMDNASNIALYAYQREAVAVKLRYDFK